MNEFNYQSGALKILREKKYYGGKETAQLLSKLSLKAAASYIADCEPGAIFALGSKASRLAVAVVQCYCREKGFNPGKIDGWIGSQTMYAVAQLEGKIDYFRDRKEVVSSFPHEKDVPTFYGNRGENQVRITTPYPLVLAWNNDHDLDSFLIHEKVADSATRAMEAILKEYGLDKIRAFALNQFGGCMNVRLKRGSKTQWSMHSWGIAIDWFPQKNQLRWGADRAWLARPEYIAFWECWEAEGWVSLGREKNFDWMHVQAARV